MEGATVLSHAAAVAHIAKVKRKVKANKKDGGELTVVLDYIEMNDPESFDVVDCIGIRRTAMDDLLFSVGHSSLAAQG